VFLTKDEFAAGIAKERDINGASLKQMLNAQVEKLHADISSEIDQQFDVRLGQMSAQVIEKLQGVMSAVANEFNVKADNLANTQKADISNEIRQQLNVKMDTITAEVVAKLDKLNDGMGKIASAKQTDSPSENLQQLNAKIDQMSARIEKNAKDILELNSMAAQMEKNTRDILKMEGALESVDINVINGVTKQVNHPSAIAESYQVQLHKMEEGVQMSANKLEEMFQEIQRLQQNDVALQMQHDYLQQQADKRGEPLEVKAHLIARMTALEESIWQLSSKENQNEGFNREVGLNREVHQLFKHLREHIESCESRVQRLECSGSWRLADYLLKGTVPI
jgi:hypothetical protein